MKPSAFPEFKDGQLREFLLHEIKQQNERNRRAKVLSVMIVVLVTVYMSFMTYSITTNFLNPTSAAQWLGFVAEENLPEYMDSTRRELLSQAPAIADELMTGVILNVPGYLADRARDQLDSVTGEQLPFVQAALHDSLSARLAEALSDSDPLGQIQKDPAFTKVFVDQLVADATAGLDETLQQQGMRGVSDEMASSLAALRTISHQLAQPEAKNTVLVTMHDRRPRDVILSCLQIMEELMEQAEGDAQSPFSPGTL